jgi:arylsulfatase A-like enzyme
MKRLIPFFVFAGMIFSSCAKTNQPPNIIVLLTDDQRTNSLSCYDKGCAIQTPNIDKLANEGIRFDNGFVVSPICVVSRASIITGRYACNNRVHDFGIPIPEEIFEDSYPARLKKAGYFVGALGKYGVGVNQLVQETFDLFEAQEGQGPAFREYKGKKMHDAEWLTVKTMEFLDAVPENKPFCVQINYKEPHGTGKPAPEDKGMLNDYFFEKAKTDSPEEFDKIPDLLKHGMGHVNYKYYVALDYYIKKAKKDSPEELEKIPDLLRQGKLDTNKDFVALGGDLNPYKRSYHEMILSVERSVGKIVKSLEERGLADNTIIIYLSDHGLHLGEKQLKGKWTPYDESLRIPFIVYDPRNPKRKGKIMDEMVLNIDIAPTILELAGIEVPKGTDGKSLVSLLDGKEKPWREEFFFEHYCAPSQVHSLIPRNEGIRTKKEKYARWFDFGELHEEYFNLENDPIEANSLIGNPEYEDRIQVLREKFAHWRKENPSNYEHVHNGIPHFATMNINWERFKKASPAGYKKIEAVVDRLGVTWEQAENDLPLRLQISKEAGFFY